MSRLVTKHIIIPACKKDAFFTDDLMMKIGTRSLIQHAQLLAVSLTDPENITLITDSHEVSDTAEQYGCNVVFDQKISFKQNHQSIIETYKDNLDDGDIFIILSPYLTNLSSDDMGNVIEKFLNSNVAYGFSAQEQEIMDAPEDSANFEVLIKNEQPKALQQIEGYILHNPSAEQAGMSTPLLIPAKARSVRSIDDYWSAERHFQARKILFRIIGNKNVGKKIN